MNAVELEAQPRETKKRNRNKASREAGRIPGVVYERDLGLEGVRRGYGLTLGPTCAAALTSQPAIDDSSAIHSGVDRAQ